MFSSGQIPLSRLESIFRVLECFPSAIAQFLSQTMNLLPLLWIPLVTGFSFSFNIVSKQLAEKHPLIGKATRGKCPGYRNKGNCLNVKSPRNEKLWRDHGDFVYPNYNRHRISYPVYIRSTQCSQVS